MEEQREVVMVEKGVEKGGNEGIVGKVGEEVPARVEWCGGMDFRHDVTICLVPNGSCFEPLNDKVQLSREKQALTKVKVHSSRLRKCSSYFETCLTERWKKTSPQGDSSHLEFVLETHADDACYVDCFSRMYKPKFFKDFKDVGYCLALLRAASQIQFLELVESIAVHLSSKLWTDTDEMAIRMYALSQDFPRKHAQELVVRLGMDENKEESHKDMCDLIEQCIRAALANDGNFWANRDFFEEMLLGKLAGNGQSAASLKSSSSNAFSFNPTSAPSNHVLSSSPNPFSVSPTSAPSNNVFSSSSKTSSALSNIKVSSKGLENHGLGNGLSVSSDCIRDVVTIVSREAMSMVVKVAQECEGKTYLSVQRFADKILAICWILETLLAAKVAEEFVEIFVHLHALPKILAIDNLPNHPATNFGGSFGAGEFYLKPGEARNVAVKLVKLVFVIYQEVAAGNLLLKTRERIALLENWHSLFGKLLAGTTCNFDQATQNLFLTLPLKQQMFLVKSRKDSTYESYISTNALAKLVKRKWPTVDAQVLASSPSI